MLPRLVLSKRNKLFPVEIMRCCVGYLFEVINNWLYFFYSAAFVFWFGRYCFLLTDVIYVCLNVSFCRN